MVAAAMLVTHDQDEARSCADRVAVMRGGVIVQEGTPTEVYGTPADLGVARFVGACVELPVTESGEGVLRTALGDLPGGLPAPRTTDAIGTSTRTGYMAVLRPEQLRFTPGPTAGPSVASGRVTAVRYHGHDWLLDITLDDGTTLPVRMLGASSAQVGDQGSLTAAEAPTLLPI